MMAQVLVAAWVGVVLGWVGFGVILQQAPNDSQVAGASLSRVVG